MPLAESLTDPHFISDYLANYAEPESFFSMDGSYDEFVGIPLFDEQILFADTARALSHAAKNAGKKVLAVLVVNSPTHASVEEKSRTLQHLAELTEGATTIRLGFFFRAEGAVDFLIVDRANPEREIPRKQGVGLARKIAFDIGCRLFLDGKITSPWARSLDADSLPPPEYFFVAPPAPAVAILYPYRHVGNLAEDPLVTLATRQYEIHLRYYEKQLSQAGSPFAYTALGSSMAIHYEAYAKVRGWPKKSAAEDFYLLNKLRSLGEFFTPEISPIKIGSRISRRVPFGTGRSTEIRHEALKRSEGPTLYHPRSFEILRGLLQLFSDLVGHRSFELFKTEFLKLDSLHPEILETIWRTLQFESAIKLALNTRPTANPLRRHLQEWFDGLKTLQFIRGLHVPNAFANLPMHEALFRAGFRTTSGMDEVQLIEEILKPCSAH